MKYYLLLPISSILYVAVFLIWLVCLPVARLVLVMILTTLGFVTMMGLCEIFGSWFMDHV